MAAPLRTHSALACRTFPNLFWASAAINNLAGKEQCLLRVVLSIAVRPEGPEARRPRCCHRPLAVLRHQLDAQPTRAGTTVRLQWVSAGDGVGTGDVTRRHQRASFGVGRRQRHGGDGHSAGRAASGRHRGFVQPGQRRQADQSQQRLRGQAPGQGASSRRTVPTANAAPESPLRPCVADRAALRPIAGSPGQLSLG